MVEYFKGKAKTVKRPLTLAAVALLGLPLVSRAEPTKSDSETIVSRHKAVFTKPPVNIPSAGAVDAPLLGNGDTLVAIGGGPGKLQFYLNKNDLWTLNSHGGSPRPLARLDLVFPELQDASYHMEQDLLTAVTTGCFEKEGRSLALETGVMATDNLLWIKLQAVKGVIQGTAQLSLPDRVPPALSGGTGRIQLGREQYDKGRWYLDGALDEVRIFGRALSADEVKTLAGSDEVADGLVRRWDFEGSIDPGTAHGTTSFVDGVRGKALQLDGKTGYVDSDPWKPGKTVTVSAFVKHNRPLATAYILSQGEWNKHWSLGLSEGKPRFAVEGVFVQAPEPIAAGQWVHLAGVCDGQDFCLYVDGRKIAELKESPIPDHVNGVQVVQRRFEKDTPIPTGAACGLRNLDGSDSFSLEPGQPIIRFRTIGWEEVEDKSLLSPLLDTLIKLGAVMNGGIIQYDNRRPL